MHLTPREQERLLLAAAADLARRRLARGAPLGATEAVALVCDEVCELAWDGLPLAEVVDRARLVIPPAALLPGVAGLVPVIEVEALFPWGSTLVHVDAPLEDQSQQPPYLERTEETLAPSPFLLQCSPDATTRRDGSDGAGGAGRGAGGRRNEIELAPGAARREAGLRNTGARDMWISSHSRSNQVNPAVEVLLGDKAEPAPVRDAMAGATGRRRAARPPGCRLDLPAGRRCCCRRARNGRWPLS